MLVISIKSQGFWGPSCSRNIRRPSVFVILCGGRLFSPSPLPPWTPRFRNEFFKRHPPRLPRHLNGTPRHLRNTVRKTTALGGSGVRPCASDFDLILGARRGWLKAECTPNLSEGCVKGKLCPSWFKAGAFSLSSASMDETSNINSSKMSHDLPSHGHPLQCNKIAWDRVWLNAEMFTFHSLLWIFVQ